MRLSIVLLFMTWGVLLAVTYNSFSTVWQRAIRSAPLWTAHDTNLILGHFGYRRRPPPYNPDDDIVIWRDPPPPPSTTIRTEFGTHGCTVFCYPSTGGVLIKHPDLVDMLFLGLDRAHGSERSADPDDEDQFCRLLRRTGAKWWRSKDHWMEVPFDDYGNIVDEEEKELVVGWPTDGVGVWVLKFGDAKKKPKDYGRMKLAMNMEERIEIMKEYGAMFFEDATQVEELDDSYSRRKITKCEMGGDGHS
ncbi:hypothetical protein K461DRAFT_282976 [Myriangium duriaei CBS 260.36]|uniref:Uncharacterized protein n=1 Tax=Myriangium duriaei CBS 260.36 TaxID=1168546 RepID=A0A9P4IU97_9PEZI|nr:hypothetical protein K461DRAFT_282976 [Myriangium duriaei CBS 260.36]